MMTDPWTVEQTEDGFRVLYDGEPWVAAPRPTQEDATAYVERLRERYRGDSASVLMQNGQESSTRRRGGPWRWTIPEDSSEVEAHGRTGIIRTERLSDAKTVLRHKMERKRLPNGIEWELAE